MEGLAEISEIEEAAPAGIGRQRGQRFARILPRLALLEDGRSGEHGVSRRSAHAGVAAGDFGQQAARVHGVDGHVGAIGGVGGGAKLGAIILARLRDAAGELHHRFFAGDVFQQIGQRLDGDQLAVGIEDVELGIVGGEGRVGVFGGRGVNSGGGGRGQRRKLRFLAGQQRVDGAIEQVAIVGEIGDHFELIAEGHHAHQIGGRHLLAQELLGGQGGAGEIVGLQGSEIEKENDQAPVANLLPHLLRLADRADGDGHRRDVFGGGLLEPLHVVIIEGGDLLILAIFGDAELVLPQALDGVAIAIGDLDVDLD